MIRRRKPVETKVNHERWLVSYADFITLLFAFFVVMYSVSQVNETAYRELAETLGGAFDQRAVRERAAVSPGSSQEKLAKTRDLAQDIKAIFSELIDTRQVQVTATDDWLEVTVNANLLFSSGSAVPSAEAETIFAQLAATLAPFDNAVEVSGHTDNVSINNPQFANNWELSAARATSVVALLNQNGVAPHRLSATGYGEFRPVADNSNEEGRASNRRVVLMVARRQAARPQVPVAELPQALDTQVDNPVDANNVQQVERREQAESRALLNPVIRKDGSLLFTNDPDQKVIE
jgi:chemotaxis protein MotB